MKVMSLFDGMSCGRIALERAGIPVKHYYASEVDKYAIAVSRKNYPAIVQLGDVRQVRQMAQHDFFGHVDLLIGGSPCQGFSFAGQQLAFNDPRSALFFEYVWILEALRHKNPNIKFMLENVKMKKEHLDIITKILGVQPVKINSALVSAQNRERYYWCNWKVEQPQDKGIVLRDILQGGPALSEKELEYMNREVSDGRNHWDFKHHSDDRRDKSAPVVANFSRGVPYNVCIIGAAQRGRPVAPGINEQRIELRDDGKSRRLTCRHKDSFVAKREIAGISELKNGFRPFRNDERKSTLSEIGTIHKDDSKSACMTVSHPPSRDLAGVIETGICYRKLSPVECERLQTVPDNYTEGVSNSQRYKMLGNGWTIDIIAHILRSMS